MQTVSVNKNWVAKKESGKWLVYYRGIKFAVIKGELIHFEKTAFNGSIFKGMAYTKIPDVIDGLKQLHKLCDKIIV